MLIMFYVEIKKTWADRDTHQKVTNKTNQPTKYSNHQSKVGKQAIKWGKMMINGLLSSQN